MEVPMENVIRTQISNPVTQAVVENIMGTLPMKKPHVRCEDCNISFTSQTVLEAHLQGARHAKQVKAKAIMAALDNNKVPFTKNQETNGLRCNVCNVSLNSMQQLQTHLNGNRHKKAVKGGWIVAEASLANFISAPVYAAKPVSQSKTTFISCDLCNKLFNSHGQYAEHLGSRKHTAKLYVSKNQGSKRIYMRLETERRSPRDYLEGKFSMGKSRSSNVPETFESN